tara:strand:- start:6232 stop:6729 length:498 start_codon:yes stop_codon:yes gene_type:complete
MPKFGFDINEVEDTLEVNTYEPVPEGEYKLQALEAEEKPNSKGTGTIIKVKFEIVSGNHIGTWIFENYNNNNPNEVAQQIGRRDLVHWATACGLPDADHTDKLLGKTFLALVGIEPANNGYKESNGIKQFRFDTEISPKKAKADKPSPKTVEDDNSNKASDNPWD